MNKQQATELATSMAASIAEGWGCVVVEYEGRLALVLPGDKDDDDAKDGACFVSAVESENGGDWIVQHCTPEQTCVWVSPETCFLL